MWPRTLAKFHGLLLGIIIGFSLACVLVLWTNEGGYVRQTPIVSSNSGEVFHMDTSALNAHVPVGQNKEQEESDIKHREARTSNDESESENDLHEAYGHVKIILFFIGYPRSRHSLVGSLLDAHPHMVVSDETMAFPRWRRNPKQWTNGSIYAFYDTLFGASQLAKMKGRRSRIFEGSVVNKTSNYGYAVPNQWQGNYDGYIEVIGDKSGAFTAGAMLQEDAVDAVRLLEKVSGAKVKFVHVVRNPFDNLATMTLEQAGVNKRDGPHQTKVNSPDVLNDQIKRYFHWAAGCNKARMAFPGQVIDIPSMEVVKHPADTLRKICAFLEITCSEDYIQDCGNTVDPVPSITRDFVVWTDKQKQSVYEQMKHFSFFDNYSYDH